MIKLPSTAKSFFNIIPTDTKSNLEFRIELHKMLAVDKQAQQVYLSMCKEYLPIIFSTTFFTFNPQMSPGKRNVPFILRPAQISAVETLDACINQEKDIGIDKTRKQGASELCAKIFIAKCLLDELSHFILGSRKKELVDCSGDPTTLMGKCDNALDCLPTWLREYCGYDPKIHRKDMQILIPNTKSSIQGETTNESFSAGSRATAICLDEFGRVDKTVADAIEGSIHDVSNCVIYSSTHWLGLNHTFAQVLRKPSTEVIKLKWYDNPIENAGLYKTPEPGVIKIIDEEYYRDKDYEIVPDVNHYDLESRKIQLIADGLKNIPSPYRAPWFDKQCKVRKGNRRDLICNVCGEPVGSADSPFDHEMLQEIREQTIKVPDYVGDIVFHTNSAYGMIDEESVWFNTESGYPRLKWWGGLPYGRPNQRHNYVIGVDPSYGLGSANSAACVFDVNLHEQVGSWVDANTKPEDFADIIVALAYWIGGVSDPLIIWESNAGCGKNFGDRVIFNNYRTVYTQRREDSKTRRRVKKWGWQSNERAKEHLLGEFGVALSGGLAGDNSYVSIQIHEDELVSELFDYIFKEKGAGIVASSRADLGTGAAERHGDRAIAAALCILGAKEQAKGTVEIMEKVPPNSFVERYKKWENEQEQEKRYKRVYLY